MKVEDGKVVKLEYSLSVEGIGVIESSEARGPLTYIHGENSLPLGLEKVLKGMSLKEEKKGSFTVEIPTMEMKRKEFPKEAKLEEGAQFAGSNQGQEINFVVEKVKDDVVIIRPQHPLAGKTLEYQIKVLEITDKG
jgi:FKBP-type peptidyl-prolyl cis-trans isomerase SlyD